MLVPYLEATIGARLDSLDRAPHEELVIWLWHATPENPSPERVSDAIHLNFF
jgi:hypothetical protein